MRLPPALLQALSGKKLLICDFDGTLADSTPIHAKAFAETLAPLGIAVDYLAIAGQSTQAAMRKLLGQRATDAALLAELVAQKQARARVLMERVLRPMPGADEFLAFARTRYQLALVTSGSRQTVGVALSRLGWGDMFETSIFAEDVDAAKPDPAGFLAVLEALRVTPDAVLVLEDSLAGFEAARQAGLDVIDAPPLLAAIARWSA